MYYIEIGKTRIPKLGLGTWQLEGETAREVVSTAIELGYRHIDTAQAYHNEAEVGAAVMSSDIRREDFFITTKVDYNHLAHDEVLASVDQSLERLGTGYVDLLLIHWPNDKIPLRETLLAFKEIMHEGRTRHIGVSNFPPGMLAEARQLAPILCEQVEYHVYLQQRDLQRYAREHELLLTAYCPLARGKVSDDEVLTGIGRPHGKSAQQVALRWLIQQPQVAAIPKASSREHLASNIDIFDFSLTPEEMEQINGLDNAERLIDPDFAPAWNR